jgi:WD40 repeat protein
VAQYKGLVSKNRLRKIMIFDLGSLPHACSASDSIVYAIGESCKEVGIYRDGNALAIIDCSHLGARLSCVACEFADDDQATLLLVGTRSGSIHLLQTSSPLRAQSYNCVATFSLFDSNKATCALSIDFFRCCNGRLALLAGANDGTVCLVNVELNSIPNVQTSQPFRVVWRSSTTAICRTPVVSVRWRRRPHADQDDQDYPLFASAAEDAQSVRVWYRKRRHAVSEALRVLAADDDDKESRATLSKLRRRLDRAQYEYVALRHGSARVLASSVDWLSDARVGCPMLASASSDGRVRIWTLSTCSVTGMPRAHVARIIGRSADDGALCGAIWMREPAYRVAQRAAAAAAAAAVTASDDDGNNGARPLSMLQRSERLRAWLVLVGRRVVTLARVDGLSADVRLNAPCVASVQRFDVGDGIGASSALRMLDARALDFASAASTNDHVPAPVRLRVRALSAAGALFQCIVEVPLAPHASVAAAATSSAGVAPPLVAVVGRRQRHSPTASTATIDMRAVADDAFATLGSDGSLTLWTARGANREHLAARAVLLPGAPPVRCMVVLSPYRVLVALDDGRVARVTLRGDGADDAHAIASLDEPIAQLAVLACGTKFAALSSTRLALAPVDGNGDGGAGELSVPIDGVTCVEPIASGSRPSPVALATGHRDGSVRLWSATLERIAGTFSAYAGDAVHSLRSIDLSRMVTCSERGNVVRVWELESTPPWNRFEAELPPPASVGAADRVSIDMLALADRNAAMAVGRGAMLQLYTHHFEHRLASSATAAAVGVYDASVHWKLWAEWTLDGSHCIERVRWLDDGSLAVRCRALAVVYSPDELGAKLGGTARDHVSLQRALLRSAHAALPAYHPIVLVHHLRAGRFALVHAIFVHLHNAIRAHRRDIKAAKRRRAARLVVPAFPLSRLIELASLGTVADGGSSSSSSLSFASASSSSASALISSSSDAANYNDLFAANEAADLGFADLTADFQVSVDGADEDSDDDNGAATVVGDALASSAAVDVDLRAVEKLLHFVSQHELASLSRVEQMSLLAVINAYVGIQQQAQALDECAKRFLLAVKMDAYSRRTSAAATRGGGVAVELDSWDIAWALQSDAPEALLEFCLALGASWPVLRGAGVGYWLRNPATLKTVAERVAKQAYLERKEPADAALWYLALDKRRALSMLFKVQGHKKLAEFLANDFTEPANRRIAATNAYDLLGKQRYTLAAAFFLLAGSLPDAIQVIVDKLHDFQLALVVARLVGGADEHSAFAVLLRDTIIPSAVDADDQWLQHIALWLLHRHVDALDVLLPSADDHSTAIVREHAGCWLPATLEYVEFLCSSTILRNAPNLDHRALHLLRRRIVYIFAHGRCPSLALLNILRLRAEPELQERAEKKHGEKKQDIVAAASSSSGDRAADLFGGGASSTSLLGRKSAIPSSCMAPSSSDDDDDDNKSNDDEAEVDRSKEMTEAMERWQQFRVALHLAVDELHAKEGGRSDGDAFASLATVCKVLELDEAELSAETVRWASQLRFVRALGARADAQRMLASIGELERRVVYFDASDLDSAARSLTLASRALELCDGVGANTDERVLDALLLSVRLVLGVVGVACRSYGAMSALLDEADATNTLAGARHALAAFRDEVRDDDDDANSFAGNGDDDDDDDEEGRSDRGRAADEVHLQALERRARALRGSVALGGAEQRFMHALLSAVLLDAVFGRRKRESLALQRFLATLRDEAARALAQVCSTRSVGWQLQTDAAQLLEDWLGRAIAAAASASDSHARGRRPAELLYWARAMRCYAAEVRQRVAALIDECWVRLDADWPNHELAQISVRDDRYRPVQMFNELPTPLSPSSSSSDVRASTPSPPPSLSSSSSSSSSSLVTSPERQRQQADEHTAFRVKGVVQSLSAAACGVGNETVLAATTAGVQELRRLVAPQRRAMNMRLRCVGINPTLVQCVELHPNAPLYASGGIGGGVHLWPTAGRASTPQQLAQPLVEYRRNSSAAARVNRVHFSGDGTLLAAADMLGQLSMWHCARPPPPTAPPSPRKSKEREHASSSTAAPTSMPLPAASAYCPPPFLTIRAHRKRVADFVFIDDAGLVVTVGKGGGQQKQNANIALWDLSLPPHQARVASFGGTHSLGASSIAHAPQRQLIVTAGKQGIVNVFDMRAPHERLYSARAHMHNIRSVAVHPTERLFATGSSDGCVKLFSLDSSSGAVVEPICEWPDVHPRESFVRAPSSLGIFTSAVSTIGVTQVAFSGCDWLLSTGSDGRIDAKQLVLDEP